MKAQQILSKIVSLILLGLISTSCSPTLRKTARYDMDDMYAVHDKEMIEASLASQTVMAAYYKEQNMQTWSEILGIKQANLSNPAAEVYLENEIYNTPYGEKIRALYADSYQLPSSYYIYSDVLEELSNYDPDEYTVTFDGDGNLIIQPKYIYSVYGSWGINSYNLHPWRYGYNRGWRPYSPYWYYNSWYYDYGWGYGWDYGLYWGYNPRYIYGYHRPPSHHMGYGGYRPHYANGFKNTIVKYQNLTPAQTQNLQVGSRQKNGSTVGTQSKSTYNRGTSSSSSSSSSSNSVVRSGVSSSSGGSSGSSSMQKSSGTANKIGR